jgi:hypothetical protein
MRNTADPLERELLEEWIQDRQIAQVLNWTTILLSFASFVVLVVLAVARGHDHWALVCLTLFSVFTRASALVSGRVYLYPRLLAEIASGDALRRTAALSVAEAHRQEILEPIAVERRLKSNEEALRALRWEDVAAWPEVAHIGWWRRFGLAWLGLWCVVAVAVAIVVTGVTG